MKESFKITTKICDSKMHIFFPLCSATVTIGELYLAEQMCLWRMLGLKGPKEYAPSPIYIQMHSLQFLSLLWALIRREISRCYWYVSSWNVRFEGDHFCSKWPKNASWLSYWDLRRLAGALMQVNSMTQHFLYWEVELGRIWDECGSKLRAPMTMIWENREPENLKRWNRRERTRESLLLNAFSLEIGGVK